LRLPKLHKTLNILIRLAIVGLSLGFIYWKVFAKGEVGELLKAFESFGNNPFFYKGIAIVSVLMIMNWSIESVKWRLLVNRIERIPFYRAVESVLTGITVSIFMPNRTGEFLGRVFILKTGDPVKAAFLTIIGSISQLLVTILLGTLAFLFVFRNFLPAGSLPSAWVNIGVISGITLFNIAMLALFFRVPVFSRLLRKMVRGHWHKVMTYLGVIESISRTELFIILMLSFFRYLVFGLQFYLMLQVFGIAIPFIKAMIIIPLIYLSLAVIPSFALSELGVRGSVSLYFIGMYFKSSAIQVTEIESMAIVLAAGLLWIINLAIPAIIGTPFVFNLRFFRR